VNPNHHQTLVLPELFEALHHTSSVDATDWCIASRFAEKWKVSVADALLDLNFIDETALAKALASSHQLEYISGARLPADFNMVTVEEYDDLLAVGAIPLEDNRLAICNPYDDLRGYLGNHLCEREMVVTERSKVYEALREQGMKRWLEENED
jgi:hypothetical protein